MTSGSTASHPVLDALTDGGLGVGLLWPFSSERFFMPLRPIHVAPISLKALLSARGTRVIASELRWVWLPCSALAAVLALQRRRARARAVAIACASTSSRSDR